MGYLKFSEHEDYRKFEKKVQQNERTKNYTEEVLKEWEDWAEQWIEEREENPNK